MKITKPAQRKNNVHHSIIFFLFYFLFREIFNLDVNKLLILSNMVQLVQHSYI